MKLSVLILTHNRSKLFERCIQSVLLNKPAWAEILVNNDTSDITEIPGATYYYEKNPDDISKTYKHLFDAAIGEFIYYLEDDDYVVSNFWDIISNDLGNDNLMYQYVPEKDMNLYFERFIYNPDINRHFQLGQIAFKKKDLDPFPEGNDIENDWALKESLKSGCISIPKPIFVQTLDGGDNMSFVNNEHCVECEKSYCRYSCERGL